MLSCVLVLMYSSFHLSLCHQNKTQMSSILPYTCTHLHNHRTCWRVHDEDSWAKIFWTKICEPRFVNQDSWSKFCEASSVKQVSWSSFVKQVSWSKFCEASFVKQISWSKFREASGHHNLRRWNFGNLHHTQSVNYKRSPNESNYRGYFVHVTLTCWVCSQIFCIHNLIKEIFKSVSTSSF